MAPSHETRRFTFTRSTRRALVKAFGEEMLASGKFKTLDDRELSRFVGGLLNMERCAKRDGKPLDTNAFKILRALRQREPFIMQNIERILGAGVGK